MRETASKFEDAMYRANAAVRAYQGPIKLPDGEMHPQWEHLLEAAASAKRQFEAMKAVRRCPTCGRLG